MTREGEKILIGASIAVVIFIITTQIVWGNEGNPEPCVHDFKGIASGTVVLSGFAPG